MINNYTHMAIATTKYTRETDLPFTHAQEKDLLTHTLLTSQGHLPT